MAEQYCQPYEQCTDLDGRLLIARTISGPALAMEEGELPFGSMSLEGGSLHPYRAHRLQPAVDAAGGVLRTGAFGVRPGTRREGDHRDALPRAG